MRRSVLISTLLATCSVPLLAQSAPVVETTVRGVVFDSLAMHGLDGATVQIARAGDAAWTRSVETDSAGHFEVAAVPAGTYLIGFFHAKLDSVGIATSTLRLDVRTAQPIDVRLGVPSARTIARGICGGRAVADSTGLLMGYLRGANNSMPRSNGSVLVRWAEILIEKGTIRRTTPSVTASSGSTGLVAVCGVPLETPLLLQASVANDSSGSFEVTVPASGFLHRDIFVAPFRRTAVATSDSVPAVDLLRGEGRLRGRIIGSNGRAIGGARVMLWGTGLETVTSDDGVFDLGGLPGGTHTLDVRAVGFFPVQRPVDIVQGVAGAGDVELTNLGITLDTVRVAAKRLYTSPTTAAFERRLRTGAGHIIDRPEIEKRQLQRLTDLLRTIPGVLIVPSKYSGDDVMMRGGEAILGGGLCRPDVYVDGAKVSNDPLFPIDQLVSVSELRALEVYARAATVPMEMRTLSGCGAILIWTVGAHG